MEHPLEIVRLIALAHEHIELGEPVQHIPVEPRDLSRPHLQLLVVMGEVAQHPAQRIADLAIGLDVRLQNLRPDAQVL